MTQRFRILHISDLHERVAIPGTHKDRLAKIKDMLAQRHRVLGEPFSAALMDVLKAGPIDFVCFTGDVADFGLVEEYEPAKARVQAILARLGLPPSRFLAVPGNHDVNRNVAPNALQEARRLIREEFEALSAWLGGRAAPKTVKNLTLKEEMRLRTEAFWQWLKNVRGDSELTPTTERYLGYRYTVPEFNVHFIGLDSAWLAHDDHDRSYLALPGNQLDRLVTNDAGAPLPGVRIALVHHPLFDLIRTQETHTHLTEYVDLLLHGHQHHKSAIQISNTNRQLYILSAGSLFEGDEGDRWVNSFQTIDVTLDGHGNPAQLDVVVYDWSAEGYWYCENLPSSRSGAGHLTWKFADRVEPSTMGYALRDATVGVLNDMRRGSLRVIDDAVMLGPVRVHGTSLDIGIDLLYDESRDEIAESSYFDDYRRSRERWESARYGDGVADYIERNTRQMHPDLHRCKLGFSAFHPTVDGAGLDRPALRVWPINHIVCEAFNRSLARDRLSALEEPAVRELWSACFRRLLRAPGGGQVYRADFPSQLFVEFALVTSDGFVPLAIKDNPTSVYAERGSPQEIWTCGIEDGPNWCDAVADPYADAVTELQFDNVVLKGLAREYKIRGAQVDKRGKKVLPNEKALDCNVLPLAGLFSLVVQTMHLNSALLGYCVLPITRNVLAEHLTSLPTRRSGGLIFDALDFVHLDDCHERVEKYRRSLRWHGTALMRLQQLVQHRQEIDSQLALLRASA